MRSRITSRLVACTCLLGIALNAGTVPASAQAVTGWTDKQQAKRAEQFARLTPEHFARTAEAHDDAAAKSMTPAPTDWTASLATPASSRPRTIS